jgi:CO dehydrogenase/acetyl-CoA synthase epsilon subunit
MSKNTNFSLSEQVAAAVTADVVVEQAAEQVAEAAMGIGQVARKLILSKPDATNKVVLERVLKLFPEAKTTAACIAWYRNDLIKKGLLESGAKRSVLKVIVTADDLVL